MSSIVDREMRRNSEWLLVIGELTSRLDVSVPFSAPVEKQNCGLSGGWSYRDGNVISESGGAVLGESGGGEDHRKPDLGATVDSGVVVDLIFWWFWRENVGLLLAG